MSVETKISPWWRGRGSHKTTLVDGSFVCNVASRCSAYFSHSFILEWLVAGLRANPKIKLAGAVGAAAAVAAVAAVAAIAALAAVAAAALLAVTAAAAASAAAAAAAAVTSTAAAVGASREALRTVLYANLAKVGNKWPAG